MIRLSIIQVILLQNIQMCVRFSLEKRTATFNVNKQTNSVDVCKQFKQKICKDMQFLYWQFCNNSYKDWIFNPSCVEKGGGILFWHIASKMLSPLGHLLLA